ncbi:hypothetical protein GPECTOR_15g286 [Gonium pectorale]|uniref:Small ribosomal subunit protein uS15c n=1 Tax=Gonium pectorale TaxID=33097 RepID=A0A150GLA2_GONPE|nr:hypothetical protein GPECTOR_15g286 [Gonium pectorale]|eukprot:KXZ50603.1 hypothetical protein GPECTOR_15g286 [Gonium pectorale]
MAAGDSSSSGIGGESSGGGGASSDSAGVDAGGAAAALANLPDPKPELVELLLGTEAAGNKALRRKAAREAVLREFQKHPADTGSPQVMVAMWTHRVRELVRHFDANRFQLPAMRELEMMVNRRQRMLTWLRRADFEAYSYTITKLGLKDIYTPAGHADRYREGLRPGDAVEDGDALNRRRFNFHTKYHQKKTSQWARLRPKLVSEDPALGAADVSTAAADKARQQRQRLAAARPQA